MQNRFKRVTMDEIYRILDMMESDQISIKYPFQIKRLQNGIGIKMFSSQENISMCFYPNHPTSQVSVVRKGMRYIYPRRDLRLKKHTFEEMIHKFMLDQRLFGITKIIEHYLIEVIKLEHPDVIESVYLS